jgi:hypothetical protein
MYCPQCAAPIDGLKFCRNLGISFLIVAIYLMRPGGEPWGVWLLIPGFGILARGIAEIIRVKQEQRAKFSSASGAVAPPLTPHGDFLAPTTSKLAPPASITEETTRHFDHSADSVQR